MFTKSMCKNPELVVKFPGKNQILSYPKFKIEKYYQKLTTSNWSSSRNSIRWGQRRINVLIQKR